MDRASDAKKLYTCYVVQVQQNKKPVLFNPISADFLFQHFHLLKLLGDSQL